MGRKKLERFSAFLVFGSFLWETSADVRRLFTPVLIYFSLWDRCHYFYRFTFQYDVILLRLLKSAFLFYSSGSVEFSNVDRRSAEDRTTQVVTGNAWRCERSTH